MDVYTHISPALHPSNVEAIEGYEQHKGYLNGVLEALSTAYEGLADTHKARLLAKKNPTMNDAGRLITVSDFAEKRQTAISKKFDQLRLRLQQAVAFGDLGFQRYHAEAFDS